MKISARNQIKGKAVSVKHGIVNTQIDLQVNSSVIKSTITKDAAEAMGIKKGDELIAIIKASNVIIATENPGKISARNVFKTKITSVKNGEVNTLVSLDADGFSITSTITTGAAEELNIKANDEVYAIVKASSVILAKD